MVEKYPPRPEGLSAFVMITDAGTSHCLNVSAELKSDFSIASNPYFATSLYLKVKKSSYPQCSRRRKVLTFTAQSNELAKHSKPNQTS